MRLLYSPTSPYARKCRVLIREKGLTDKVAETEVLPFDDHAFHHDSNPLGKVPVLSRVDAPALINSPLICEYLDSLSEPRWVPKSGPARWRVLRFEALGDGLMDLTMGRRIEIERDRAQRNDFWIGRQERGIARTLDALDSESDKFASATDLGAMTVAVALGYVDFRYPEADWRKNRPALRDFHDRWSERKSFQDTAPA